MKTVTPLLSVGLGALLASTAQAQIGTPQYDTIAVTTDSGAVANPAATPEVVISFQVHAPGANWVRLYFEDVQLSGDVLAGNGAVLRITSWLDGDTQELNARHLQQWQNSTAYFNGDTVQVEVLAQPNTGASRVAMRAVDAGIATTAESQCGQVDDRVLSSDPRSGRLLPVGCTGWLINDCRTCALTAGHCTGNISVLQFGVPLSNNNGSLNNPPASDQYAVDAASVISNGGQGVGNDWAYFGTFPNPNTGLTAAEAQGGTFTLAAPPSTTAGNDIRITGYGTDNTPSTHNQVQQTHVGPLVDLFGTRIGYVTDTTGGNSGSPVIHEQTGNAVGIHTHGGCNTDGTGSNFGTQSSHPDLQAALSNPAGICGSGGISLANGVPSLLEPGVPFTIQVIGSNTSVAGTQMLHYRSDANSLFSQIPMTALAGFGFEAELPGFACGDSPEFYISSQDSSCGLITIPSNAPTNVFFADVGVLATSFLDSFQTDMGWTTTVLGASTGAWQRAVPINDPNWAFDPEADADDSGRCYLTQNTAGNSDVDGGSVRLISPALDLAANSFGIRYSYYLNLTNDDGNDDLVVEISANGTAGPWVTLAVHNQNNGLEWTPVEFSQFDIRAAGATISADMRVRFTATDAATATIVEAGVDAFSVGSILCEDSLGSVFCSPAEVNSTGQPGVIAASGSIVASDNNLTLTASSLPANQFGFFINSTTQGFTPNPNSSQGNLCLDGDIGRYNMPVLSSDASGNMSMVLDLANTPTPAGFVGILSGQTWNFQAWHRDLNPTPTSNFTNGLSISFL